MDALKNHESLDSQEYFGFIKVANFSMLAPPYLKTIQSPYFKIKHALPHSHLPS